MSSPLDTKHNFVSTLDDVNMTRSYTMRARGESVARTRTQILEAGMALWEERLTVAIGLSEVAERAGVTVRTVLRHFGSRDGLFDALAAHARAEVASERETPVGDIPAAVRTIVDHYEARGAVVMRMLEEAQLDERIADLVQAGKQFHREWVRAVFAPELACAPQARALEDLLVVATDVYTWQLLRRDAGLSQRMTEQRIQLLIERLIDRED